MVLLLLWLSCSWSRRPSLLLNVFLLLDLIVVTMCMNNGYKWGSLAIRYRRQSLNWDITLLCIWIGSICSLSCPWVIEIGVFSCVFMYIALYSFSCLRIIIVTLSHIDWIIYIYPWYCVKLNTVESFLEIYIC